MFRIRRIYDEVLPANRNALDQVKTIMRSRFPAVPSQEIDQLGRHLHDPFLKRFRAILFVAENMRQRVQGFAFVLHEPQIRFCYLDWIATQMGKTSGGIGGALYDRVRREAVALGAKGLFFECLPDEAALCQNEALLVENRKRLRFYEQYGARPIIHTAYETPYKADQTCMPHLMFDGLGRTEKLQRDFLRAVVRAILERKYAGYVPADYIKRVVNSIDQDPVRLRDFRYLKPSAISAAVSKPLGDRVALVVHDRHTAHHITEQGYVESPVRVRSILKELAGSQLFEIVPAKAFPSKWIESVHDSDFVNFVQRACLEIEGDSSVYPYVFPIRNKARPPKDRFLLAGYFCIDTFTPITRNAYAAARRAVDCTLTAAQEILRGRRLAYALVRPPGHHAERRAFGGFCYFNNNAIAAQFLRTFGRVAILDIDFHHGNGQQDIFYHRQDVLTVSIHGDPSFAYPYFSGFRDEVGAAEGIGFNLNLPLPEATDGNRYRKALSSALRRVADFKPDFLVVALGLDTAQGDPTGSWVLTWRDFELNGRLIGELGAPILVVQEGGYRTRTLGINARHFFKGLAAAHSQATPLKRSSDAVSTRYAVRHMVKPEDPLKVRRLMESVGLFNRSEVEMAVGQVMQRMMMGPTWGYSFVFAEQNGRLRGYACYGPAPLSASSYTLHWVAVASECQRTGLGRLLFNEIERLARLPLVRWLYIEISSRPQYDAARGFFEQIGFRLESRLVDFYGQGDSKMIYSKPVCPLDDEGDRNMA